MMWESRFKGEYLSNKELGERRPTFTIKSISVGKMENEKKKEVDRAIIWFKEIERGWIYCKTSGHCMAAMFGANDDEWIGKRVTLFADPDVHFGAEQVGGIRVAGSPDLEKPLTIRIKFPKKRGFEVPLTVTVAPKTAPQTQPQQQEKK